MIEMTQPNTNNDWGLTIGQFEVHGYIYDYLPSTKKNCITIINDTNPISKLLFLIIFL